MSRQLVQEAKPQRLPGKCQHFPLQHPAQIRSRWCKSQPSPGLPRGLPPAHHGQPQRPRAAQGTVPQASVGPSARCSPMASTSPGIGKHSRDGETEAQHRDWLSWDSRRAAERSTHRLQPESALRIPRVDPFQEQHWRLEVAPLLQGCSCTHQAGQEPQAVADSTRAAYGSRLPSRPRRDAQPSSDLPALAAAARGGPWGDASPRPAHIAPSSTCPAQAAPRTHPTTPAAVHARSLAHRHACMHTHAQRHIHMLACTRARTHVHTRGLAAPTYWQVPGDAHCHHPSAGPCSGARMRRDPGCCGHVSPGHALPLLTPSGPSAHCHFHGHSRADPKGPSGIAQPHVLPPCSMWGGTGQGEPGGHRRWLLPGPVSITAHSHHSLPPPTGLWLPSCASSLISVISGRRACGPLPRFSLPVGCRLRTGTPVAQPSWGHGLPGQCPAGLLPAQHPQSCSESWEKAGETWGTALPLPFNPRLPPPLMPAAATRKPTGSGVQAGLTHAG